MKRLHFNSTLNHKRDGYNTYEVSVEKVITLCGDEFSKLKNFTLDDNRYIARYHKQMCIDSENVAHCLLFVDNKSGDGILVDSEGAKYARKSQFIPNARALIENNELTGAERRIHAYVEGCIGAYIGDDNYNLSCDWDGDGTITQADLDNAKAYIEANDQLNISGLAH